MASLPNSYELKFEQRPGYLYAHVEADAIDSDAVIEYLREVANKCHEAECSRLMVVRNIPITLGIANQFLTTTDFVAMLKGIKAAFVNHYPHNDAELEFAITVANNRGGNIHLFRDVQPAEEWLLSNRRN